MGRRDRRVALLNAAALLAAAALLVLTVAAAAPAAAPPRQLKVGLVLLAGIHDAFEGPAYRGLVRATRKLGVRGRVLVAGQKEGALPYFLYLARRRYDLVIGLGALQLADLYAAARRFPRVKFLVLDSPGDGRRPQAANVQGTVHRVEEPAYLAGYLAALTERRRPGPDVVSTVGGLEVPQVDRFIAGFRAGARKAVPGIRTLNAYAHNFTTPAICRAVALRQIAGGSGVVFPVAGSCGLGALAAARDEGRFGVGVDVDQSALGPYVLTSVIKRLDVVVFRAVDALARGRFRTGIDRTYGIRGGAVALGKISPRVPRRLVAQVRRLRTRLLRGDLPPIPTTLR